MTDTPSSTITVRFFARLREQLNTDCLELPIDANTSVADVLSTLAARGDAWQALCSDRPVMIAVNQTMAKPTTILHPRDEVAFFPPVTGGLT